MQDKSKIKTEFDKSILCAIDRKTTPFLYSDKEAVDTLLIWPDAHVVATSLCLKIVQYGIKSSQLKYN